MKARILPFIGMALLAAVLAACGAAKLNSSTPPAPGVTATHVIPTIAPSVRASVKAEGKALAKQRFVTQAKANFKTCQTRAVAASLNPITAYLAFRSCMKGFYPSQPGLVKKMLKCVVPAAYAYFTGGRTPAGLSAFNDAFGRCAQANA